MKTLKTKWLELATLAIALTALVFSWQANMIGRSQITSRIILIDSKLVQELPSLKNFNGHLCLYGSAKDLAPRLVCTAPENLYCIQQFRIANLGGASTSIVDFQATVSYLDQEMLLRGNGDPVVSNTEQGNYFGESTISLMPSKESVHIRGFDPYSSELPLPSIDLLSLPTQIDEYSTVDIFSETMISSKTLLDAPFYTSTWGQETYASVNVNYSFLFSSGKRLVIPAIPCIYVVQ